MILAEYEFHKILQYGNFILKTEIILLNLSNRNILLEENKFSKIF